MPGTLKELDQEYKDIIGGSPFWQDKSTESLKQALAWRKKELEREDNRPAKQAEAKRAIRALEREITLRTKGKA